MAGMITAWSPEKKHSDVERWICIYPAYLNSKKTLAQGRRLPKSICVENPTHQEIRDVLLATGLRVGVENKLYPREQSKEMTYRGRIRVQIKNDDGTPVKSEFTSRESVMKYIGESIPKLKTRQNRYMKNSLWDKIFTTLLNVPDCNNLPDLLDLKSEVDSVLSGFENISFQLRNFANVLKSR